MKKTSILLSILIAVATFALAQETSIPNLAQMNSEIKNPYVKIESLDRWKQELTYFDTHPVQDNEQKQMLFDTYRLLANGYSANNHFKQGYTVYQKYIGLKEKLLSLEKEDAILRLSQELESQQSKDENELINSKNEIQQLQHDNTQLEKKRKSFKNYFSFGVIVLTVLFSFLLLQAGLKMNKIRQDLKAGRERLKNIHRIASIGRLLNGMQMMFNNSFSAIQKLTETSISIAEQLPPSSNKKNDELIGLKKQLADLKNLS